MNTVLVATIIIVAIIGSGIAAATSVFETSVSSTLSSDIDNLKKSENLEAVYSDGLLKLTNTGGPSSHVAMLKFYDGSGNEIRRVVGYDGFGRNFSIDNPNTLSTKLSLDQSALLKHDIVNFTPSQLGLASFDGVSGEVITKYGNVFPIKIANYSTSNATGTGNGTAMINGMGLQSRIIQTEYLGKLIHGSGVVGSSASLKPYFPVSGYTDFAATVLDGDVYDTYVIPDFGAQYELSLGSLFKIDNNPNILSYLSKRDILGTPSVSINNGLEITGAGTTILKLKNMAGINILLGGNIPDGNIKLVRSVHDLINIPYTTDGFELYSEYKTVPATSFVSGSCYYTSTWYYCSASGGGGTNPVSASPNIKVGKEQQVTAKYQASYSGYYVYATNCSSKYGGYSYWQVGCRHYASGSTETVMTPTYSGYDEITKYYTLSSVSGVVAASFTYNGNVKIYDKKPYDLVAEFTNQQFNYNHVFTNDDYYLIVTTNSANTANIKGVDIATGSNILEISNLPANKPYQITQDGFTVLAGVTTIDGNLTVLGADLNLGGTGVGQIQIYDSLSYRGPFSTVIFDNLNGQTIHIPTVEDKVYTVYAYAQIPVTGSVSVTNTNLDNTLDLFYLNGNYITGNKINVPVIPGYHTINMEINGIATSLDYSDILGGTGLKIADPATSTITNSNTSSQINSAEATVGTVAYAIAVSDGVMNAKISETISGRISITNKYVLSDIPPPPPAPYRRDPLSGWVDVYVNGIFIQQNTLGINPFPDFVPTASLAGNLVTDGVMYSYPDYSLSGNVSVNVSSGDFVEFYVYSKIHGDIDTYSPPAGKLISSSSGVSSATAAIKSADIITSM